jgi:hypothetical protein
MRRAFARAVVPCLVWTTLASYAKDPPTQIILWPDHGPPVMRFTFGKFKEVGSVGNEWTFMTETTAENLWSKTIADATFTLHLYDRNKVRIGEATVNVSNVGPGETVKFQTTIASSGSAVSLSLAARSVPRELGPATPPRGLATCAEKVSQGNDLVNRRSGAQLQHNSTHLNSTQSRLDPCGKA